MTAPIAREIVAAVSSHAWPLLQPAEVAGARPPAASGAGRYVRSFLVMRLFIGGLSVLLPITLVTLDWWLFDGRPGTHIPRASESAYYYSGLREVFTITLGTTSFFLITYKITEKNLDNLLSLSAGLAGMLIPLFPTARPDDIKPPPPLTPIQHALGEKPTEYIHFGAALVFILCLAGMSVLFGLREGRRAPHGNRIPAWLWRAFHFTCAGIIVAAVVWVLLTSGTHPVIDGPYQSTLIGEWVVATAFGASWFLKGAELLYVFGHDEPAPQTR